jgi:mono/diheme cytochrome c family protein
MGYSQIVRGHVESIARGINVPNAQANQQGLAAVNPIFTWVRLAQRIPVRIHIDEVPEGVVLAAGMTATVQIDPRPRPPAAASSAATPAPGDGGAAPAGGATCCKAGDLTPPPDLVKNTPKGQLNNPYNDKIGAIAEEGHHDFLSLGCNGCHGGGGGGGMCPPLTNDIWVYGRDDDTLFRLITLGSDALQKQGYSRIGQELVVGPMPPFGGIIKNSDELWKVIAWIRSVNPNSLKPATVYPPWPG